MSSGSSTAVNPPTPCNLSSLTSSTPSSSDFVFVSQLTQNAMTNAATIPASMDHVQMSLSSLSHGLSLEEALMRVSDLMKENADLKAVLQQNNLAMKEQCQVLVSVKHQWGAEREEMKHKFDQTRTIMMELRAAIVQKEERIKNLEEQLSQKLEQNNLSSREESLSASHSAEMNSLKQRRQDAETQAELHAAQNRFLQKQTEKLNERIEALIEEKARVEADNRKLTEENERIRNECDKIKEALTKQTELNNHLKMEKRDILSVNTQLNEQIYALRLGAQDTSLALISEPTSDVLFDKEFVVVQKSAAREGSGSGQSSAVVGGAEQEVPPGEETRKLEDAMNVLKLEQGKCEELEAKYAEQCTLVESLRRQVSEKDQLLVVTNEKLTSQLDAVRKDHNQDMEQLRKQLESQPNFEHTALQAQVMTLLHEVKETERKLTAALQSVEDYKKTCSELRASVVVYEEAKLQQSHTEQVAEGLRSQIASLEANLKLERTENQTKSETLQELRSSFDQLCNDYHELLSSSEEANSDLNKEKKPASCQTTGELLTEQLQCELIQKIDSLMAQLITANDALSRTEEEISIEKAKVRQLEEEDVPVLVAQAEVYKGDFEDERAAREKQQQEILMLTEEVRRLQQELLKVMKQKHPSTPTAAASPHHPVYRSLSPPSAGEAALEQLRCPLCQEAFPDTDSLQFHVNECLA